MTLSPVTASTLEAARFFAFSSLNFSAPVLIWQPPNDRLSGLPIYMDATPLIAAKSFVLSTTLTRCQIGLLPINEEITGAWLNGISDEMNPLQILAMLCHTLPASSPITWLRSEGAAPATPHWLDFWLRCAQRLSCTIEAFSTDGALVRTSASPPKWTLDFANENFAQQIQSLFHEVFGSKLIDAHYRWKYAATGGGVVALSEGKVIAHCGALMRAIFICGKPSVAAQLVDVMVHPNYRGILRKQGIYFETTASAIELFGPLAFGFPSNRHLKLGQKHGFYEPVDPLVELQWPVRNTDMLTFTRLLEIDFSNPNHCKKIEGQWLAMASDLKNNTVGIRDLNWIRYRYREHPIYQHFFFAVACRWTGRWKGVVIARKENDALLILDWIGHLKHLPELAKAAVRLARRYDCAYCSTWVTERFAAKFQKSSPTKQDPCITVPTIVWCGDPREQTLRHWWLSPGDSDFR